VVLVVITHPQDQVIIRKKSKVDNDYRRLFKVGNEMREEMSSNA